MIGRVVPVVIRVFLLFGGLWALAHGGANPDDLDQLEQQAFRAAVEKVSPSVVRIETVGGLERVGKVLFGTGPTTGLVIDQGGYILSSAFNFQHRPASILVRLPNGTRKPAKLVATDHNRMVVLLKIEVPGPLAVPETAPQADVRVGQWAIAVGRTFEAGQTNVSVGVVSAINRIWGKAIQTDAAVSPNNYGGPLIDVRGRVIGLLVPLSPQSAEEIAGVQWYDSGIGFAVPVGQIQKALPRLKNGEDLYPGVMGVGFAEGKLYVGEADIATCRPNSPAYVAGLRPRDRIVRIGDREIRRAAEVKEEISRRYAGETVRVVVLRDDRRSEHQVELAAKLEPYEHPFLGILPMRARPGEADEKARGVAVRYVYPEGPAATAGIEPGDVLVALEGKKIKDAAKLRQWISEFQPEEEVGVEVRRAEKTLKLKFRLGRLPEQLPAEELPPAGGEKKSGTDKRPEVDTVELKIPEFENDAWAYVPEDYDPAVPHGVVIWLSPPGKFDEKEAIARWKPHCRRHDLILLVPKPADAARWHAGELTLVRKLLDQISSHYTVDPLRVVAHGQEGGGTLASLLAFRHRDKIAAVAVVDAPLAGLVPENDPAHRLAFYVATATESRSAAGVEKSVARLREMKYPVSVKSLGKAPRYLNPADLTELARWIDTLDRI